MSKIFDALNRRAHDAGVPPPAPMEGDLEPLQSAAMHVEFAPASPDLDRQPEMEPMESETVAVAEVAPSVVSESPYRMVGLHLQAQFPVLPFDGVDPRAAEQYRILRTNLLYHSAQPRVITVSSAGSGEGKTISSINMVGALALKSDLQVLLVDADMRRPSVARMLGIEASPGLGDVLLGEVSLDDAIVRLEQLPNLHILPTGKITSNPAEMLDSRAWKGVVTELRKRFRIVVLDTTPVASVADFDLVQAVSDGVVLVVRPDFTDRSAINHALQMIPVNKLLGTLLNCSQDWLFWKTQGGYGYGAK